MTHSAEHQRTHTKMVKQAFKAVTRQTGIPYPVVFQRFIDAEPVCNELVWEAFYRLYPDSPYHYVTFSSAAPSTCTRPNVICSVTALSGNTGFQPRPMKALFQRNGVWADLLETYPLREVDV